jgi:hypothetical protein
MMAAVRRCTAHVRKPPGALGVEDARANWAVWVIHARFGRQAGVAEPPEK